MSVIVGQKLVLHAAPLITFGPATLTRQPKQQYVSDMSGPRRNGLDSDRVDESIREAKSRLRGDVHVVDLWWEWYEDWSGNEALKIRVTLDRSLEDDDLQKVSSHDIKDTVRSCLQDNGVTLFPYFDFVREGEGEDAATASG